MYLSKFQEFKIYIVHFTDLARDTLHIFTQAYWCSLLWLFYIIDS